jgi:HAD superfamily hydrolase (TIGR01490 family)
LEFLLIMALAIFDLDNTLLRGDSDHAWGEFLIQQGIVDAHTYQARNDAFYADYLRGELDILAYLAFALEPLSRLPATQLAELQQQFMNRVVADMFQPKASKLLAQHRQAGDYLLIITATNRFVTQPIADALGVDDLLASEPEFIDGRYTGKATGIPCYRDGKVSRLKQWLVDNPFELRAVALDQGWPIISLREA